MLSNKNEAKNIDEDDVHAAKAVFIYLFIYLDITNHSYRLNSFASTTQVFYQ